MRIVNCQISHLASPLGFDLGKPVFSWTVEDAKGKRQTEAAFRLWAGENLLLDTGFSADLSSLGFSPEISLQPRTCYSWQVTVRTDAGEETESERNAFETGKMDEPWQGKWISAEKAERQIDEQIIHELEEGLTAI